MSQSAMDAPTLAERIRHDLPASIVVFLVALPLCLGIAIASGAPPAAGLITGIVGGLVVGTLAGSPMQVSGPAAGLTVIVYQFVQQHGLAALGITVAMAGIFQMLAGLLRIGQWFRAVSPAVIEGMLAGIGVLIFGSQLHVMLDDKPRANGIANLLAIPDAFVKSILPFDGSTHHIAAMVGLASIIALVVWKKFAPRKLRAIPAPLVAVVVGTGLVAALRLPVQRVNVPESILGSVQFLSISQFSWPQIGQYALSAAAIALIASAETLLCASAVDQMHRGPRTKYDREIMAQGVGNLICGFTGGLPMTGVIVRSSANVEAGAKSRLSAVFHGAWLLLLVVAIPGLLGNIPTASLAAVLVFTGLKLVDIKAARELAKYGKSEALIFIVTCVMIVVTDLLTGVLVGVGLSIAKLLYVFTHLKIEVKDDAAGNRTDLHLTGAATFLRLPKIAAVLETVRPNTTLHVHLDRLTYVDHACLDLFMNWEQQHDATGGALVMDWASFTAKFQGPPEGQSETGRSASERTLAHSGTPAAAHAELLPEPAVTSARAP